VIGFGLSQIKATKTPRETGAFYLLILRYAQDTRSAANLERGNRPRSKFG
jgi:hypothetical protein